jgi:hypothetical protein
MHPKTIEVSVRTPKDIFETPEYFSVNPHYGEESAIETIKKKIYLERRMPKSAYEFRILIDDLQGVPKDAVIEAVRTYCANRIPTNDLQIGIIRREGKQYFIFALGAILLGIGIFAALAFLFPSLQDSYLGKTVAGIFVVAAWVVLWDPIEELAYSWRPLKHENDVYRLLIGSSITII